jgi:hypothetical protein
MRPCCASVLGAPKSIVPRSQVENASVSRINNQAFTVAAAIFIPAKLEWNIRSLKGAAPIV